MQSLTAQKPLVSVVIATYNMGQYIAQAVDSIIGQNWPTIEIIVVDDGSQDDTPTVMQRYCNDLRIRYIRNANQGQPKAKNCGIAQASGDYIAFCDADDFWELDKLEIQMPLFENSKVGVVYSEISNIDEHNQRYEKPPAYKRHTGKVTNELLSCNFVPFGTAIIRRACVEKNGAFDEQFRMGIDWDLWLRYSLDWEFAFTPARTYVYREWSGQMSNNYRGRYDHAIRILNHFVNQHGKRLNARELRKAWADMFVNQANAIAINEQKYLEPLSGYLRGIATDPTYWPGWKSLAKFMLGLQRKKP